MTDLGTSTSLISATTYDPANRLSTIVGSVYNESRSYNSMGQLIALTSNSVSMAYGYSTTQNNGKITSQTDNTISGEQVVYTYDALNRLASATSMSGAWGQSYSYDGFGNLTNQTVTAGTAPSLGVTYIASNNRQSTDCSDANGNINSLVGCPTYSGAYGYDVSNRIVWVSGNTSYAYAPGNERVWRGTTSTVSNHLTLDELTFWSVTGQKLATYTIQGDDPTVLYNPPTPAVVLATSNYYFGHKLIKNGNGYIGADRLGSVGKFYPWGQEKPSATTNGTEKFTGYFRDSETGNDYGINRYHQPGMGRFLTPDPYMAKAGGAQDPSNPGSWDQYAYAMGDPVSLSDPKGLFACQCDKSDVGDDDDDDGDGGGDGGGGGGGGAPGAAPDPNCSRVGFNSGQQFDYSIIMGDANALKLNLSGYAVTNMQIAAGWSGNNSQTELVLTGNAAAQTTLLASLCTTNGFNASQPNCFANAGYDSMHPGTSTTQINYRQNQGTYSLQITGWTTSDGTYVLNIDIDPNNPMGGAGRWLGHAGNVVSNTVSRTDTNYSKVQQSLLSRGINGACP